MGKYWISQSAERGRVYLKLQCNHRIRRLQEASGVLLIAQPGLPGHCKHQPAHCRLTAVSLKVQYLELAGQLAGWRQRR